MQFIVWERTVTSKALDWEYAQISFWLTLCLCQSTLPFFCLNFPEVKWGQYLSKRLSVHDSWKKWAGGATEAVPPAEQLFLSLHITLYVTTRSRNVLRNLFCQSNSIMGGNRRYIWRKKKCGNRNRLTENHWKAKPLQGQELCLYWSGSVHWSNQSSIPLYALNHTPLQFQEEYEQWWVPSQSHSILMNERPWTLDGWTPAPPPNSKPTSSQQKRKEPQYNLKISLIIAENGKPYTIHIQLWQLCSRGIFA